MADPQVMGYLKLYVLLLERAKPRLAAAMRLCAHRGNLPLLVHCIHGGRCRRRRRDASLLSLAVGGAAGACIDGPTCPLCSFPWALSSQPVHCFSLIARTIFPPCCPHPAS